MSDRASHPSLSFSFLFFLLLPTCLPPFYLSPGAPSLLQLLEPLVDALERLRAGTQGQAEAQAGRALQHYIASRRLGGHTIVARGFYGANAAVFAAVLRLLPHVSLCIKVPLSTEEELSTFSRRDLPISFSL